MSETILTPPARLDSVTAPVFEAAALEGLGARVLMDFAGVAFVSSAGLRAVLVIAKKVRAQGGRLVLCGLSPAVAEVFAISGFNAILTIASDRAAGLASLQA